MAYFIQRIIQNHFQWTRPSPGRTSMFKENGYVAENGFGHEDWNFNKSLLIDGFLYGYSYYHPRDNTRTNKFNFAFGTYINSQWYLIGFYLDCVYVDEPPVSREVLLHKMRDLRQISDSLGRAWKYLSESELIAKLEEESQWLKWQVSPDNVVRTFQPIAIPEKIYKINNYHFTRPTEIHKNIFDSLYSLAQEHIADDDYGSDDEFPEGREFEVRHKSRERHQGLIKLAKDLFKRKNGQLKCQVCTFDFYDKYGEVGQDFIEGHHTVPISTLKNEAKTKVKDIALVCSNCHRMLHRRRPWLKMKDIKDVVVRRRDGKI